MASCEAFQFSFMVPIPIEVSIHKYFSEPQNYNPEDQSPPSPQSPRPRSKYSGFYRYGSFRKLGVPYLGVLISKDPTIFGNSHIGFHSSTERSVGCNIHQSKGPPTLELLKVLGTLRNQVSMTEGIYEVPLSSTPEAPNHRSRQPPSKVFVALLTARRACAQGIDRAWEHTGNQKPLNRESTVVKP